MGSPGFPGTPTSEPTTPTYGSPLSFNFADLDLQFLQQRVVVEGQQVPGGAAAAVGVDQRPVGAVTGALLAGRQASPPLPGSPGLARQHSGSSSTGIFHRQHLMLQQQQQHGGQQPAMVPFFPSAAVAAASGGAGSQAARGLGAGGLPRAVIAAEEATSVDHFLARSNLLIIAPPGASKEGTPTGSPLLPRSPHEPAAAGGGGRGDAAMQGHSISSRMEGFQSGMHHQFSWPSNGVGMGPDAEVDNQEVRKSLVAVAAGFAETHRSSYGNCLGPTVL